MDEQIKQIRQKNHQRNHLFDYDSNTIDLLVDQGSVSNEVINHLDNLGFQVGKVSQIDLDKLNQYEQKTRERADQLLRYFFLGRAVPTDLNRLIEVSREENPELVAALQSGRDVDEILKEQFYQILFTPGNISVDAMLNYLEKETFHQSKVNQLTLLYNTNLVAPLLLSPEPFIGRMMPGLSYHPLGRKGKVFGWAGVFKDCSKDNKKNGVMVNATSIMAFPEAKVDNFIKEILNHEIVGHGIMDLRDHNGMKPEDCVMATKKSTAEYVYVTNEAKGLYFCEDCKKRA